jgi:hypothetical protein
VSPLAPGAAGRTSACAVRREDPSCVVRVARGVFHTSRPVPTASTRSGPTAGLPVAPIVERRSLARVGRDRDMAGEWNAWGERLGDPMQLPASYVREHPRRPSRLETDHNCSALWPVHHRSLALYQREAVDAGAPCRQSRPAAC